MNIDIFKVNKLGLKSYQIISPLSKNTFKKTSSETETVYVHKNLQLVVDNSGNKSCYEVIPKEVKNMNEKFIINYYQLNNMSIVSFPFLDKYDDQYERTIDKYIYKNIEFMMIRENETLFFRIKDDVDLEKFIKEIV